jgi:hypothetical protein
LQWDLAVSHNAWLTSILDATEFLTTTLGDKFAFAHPIDQFDIWKQQVTDSPGKRKSTVNRALWLHSKYDQVHRQRHVNHQAFLRSLERHMAFF